MGKVYLVGAGPGAPDLLTLRAARLLAGADVVFYDALVHPQTVALAVKARRVLVGKRAGRLSTEQRFINRALVEAGLRHHTVVRLKGGDPMLFGRAQEEIDALRTAGVECEVVPGVTAALTAAASIKTSLTRRGVARSVTFATPRVAPGAEDSDWIDAATNADTAILYMAASNAAQVTTALLAAGRAPDTPVVVVENASLPDERQLRTTLRSLPDIAHQSLTGPTLVCIGAVFATPAEASANSIAPNAFGTQAAS